MSKLIKLVEMTLILGLLLALLALLPSVKELSPTDLNLASNQLIIHSQTLMTPSVKLSPGASQIAFAGSIISYTHILTNIQDTADSFLIEVTSSEEWLMTVQGSAHFTGSLGSANLTGSLQLPLEVGAGLTTTVLVNLFAPTDALSGTTDFTTIKATSLNIPTVSATVINTTTVQSRTHTVFLPMLVKTGKPVAKLGVDFSFIFSDTTAIEHDLPVAKEMGSDWVRYWISWPKVETEPGVYNWDEADQVIAGLDEAGLNPLIVIYGAPPWAAEIDCGPISDTAKLEEFLQIVIQRYGDSVDAWEFTNEPDGRDHEQLTATPIAGCWGLEPEAYAEQLGIFYRSVKQHDSRALVLFGGLAYDNWEFFERSFFDKTLQNGAGSYFDVVSLHYYPVNPAEFPTMAHKIDEIEDIMSANDVKGKQIWITETGMWVDQNGSLEHQQNFIVQELTRGFCSGADNMFWFEVRELPPYRNAKVERWLIDINHQPINAYYTYQNFAQKLKAGFVCPGPYKQVPNDVEAYQFSASGQSLYIMWSNATTQAVTISATDIITITSRDGDNIYNLLPDNGQVTFDAGPQAIFVEVTE